jgi:hypothetical protein
MGKALNFTLYKTDDDSASIFTDRQRLEMKVYGYSPDNLLAYNNSNFVYAWWFKLNPELICNPNGRFWHIFQIKAVGTDIDSSPMFTFTLSNTTEQFHFRQLNVTTGSSTHYPPVSDMSFILNRWIQAFVEVQYKNGESNEETLNLNDGYVRVILKDQYGVQIYPLNDDSGVMRSNMFWDGVDYARPKWGLYRAIANEYNDFDYELFQNVQIWQR